MSPGASEVALKAEALRASGSEADSLGRELDMASFKSGHSAGGCEMRRLLSPERGHQTISSISLPVKLCGETEGQNAVHALYAMVRKSH